MGFDRRDVSGWGAATAVAAALLGSGMPSSARADEGDAPIAAVLSAPTIPAGVSYSQRLADSLTLLGDTIDGHLGTLTLDSVKFRVDGRARKAELRLVGETRYLTLRIDGLVHFRHGVAQVDATIDLRVAGHGIRFELPDFEVAPRSYLGERYVEVRVPLVRGTF